MVSGFWFLYFSVFGILIVPTILLYRIPARIRMFIEPYVKEATILIGGERAEENDDEAVLGTRFFPSQVLGNNSIYLSRD
jgi:hypothetical protein